MFKKYRQVHFVGIGGIGMSGIAEVMINLGFKVSGSDLKRSAVTARLRKKGARIFYGHKPSQVDHAQVVVVSSAVAAVNPEIKQARIQGIPVVPRAEMLAELMRLKYSVAVAGTHGKTTTTSLVGAILAEAGLDPTLIIGGRVNHLRSNARLGQGEYLVAEADESDRSFLKLTPTLAIITNIDPEHMENYENFDQVRSSFAEFANKVPFYGAVVACADHPEVRKILPQINRRVVTYGLKEGAEFTAAHVEQEGLVMSFDVLHHGKLLGRARVSQPGMHHVGNALAAIAVARELDIPFAKIVKGLKRFAGVGRRFQILKKEPPMIVDDYAHHPVEIEATLKAARAGWPHFKIAAVMQPHRYTRLNLLFDDFVRVLKTADWVGVLPVYGAGEKPIAHITGEKLAEKVKGAYGKNLEALQPALQQWADEQTMILCLGAGDITRMAKQMAKQWQ